MVTVVLSVQVEVKRATPREQSPGGRGGMGGGGGGGGVEGDSEEVSMHRPGCVQSTGL